MFLALGTKLLGVLGLQDLFGLPPPTEVRLIFSRRAKNKQRGAVRKRVLNDEKRKCCVLVRLLSRSDRAHYSRLLTVHFCLWPTLNVNHRRYGLGSLLLLLVRRFIKANVACDSTYIRNNAPQPGITSHLSETCWIAEKGVVSV